MRVHELAKEMGIDSKTVIQILKETESIGLVKNHMSSVDEDQKGVVKLGLAAAEEPFALTFTESDLDETSFDEYVDDDIPKSSTEDEDSELTFGQQAFAKAKTQEMTSAEKETEIALEHFDHGENAWDPDQNDGRHDHEVQEVIVERPKGFMGWLKGLF